jgi:tripartite-type tricarboxylate transporter receptor subunit TctC
MFIDADIGFDGQAVATLMAADKDIACGIYPKKEVDWAKVEQAAKEPEFIKFAQERDARPDYIAPEKIISTMDKRREVVKEIMAKAGLLKESN